MRANTKRVLAQRNFGLACRATGCIQLQERRQQESCARSIEVHASDDHQDGLKHPVGGAQALLGTPLPPQQLRLLGEFLL